MNEREYLRLKKQILDEYQKNLAALDLVWKMSGGKKSAKAAPKASKNSTLSKAIRKVIQSLESEFTVRDIEASLRQQTDEQVNRSTISHTLKRLAETGQLAIKIAGAGKRATVYVKPVSRCSDDQAQEIRTLLRDYEGFDAQRFKEEILIGEYGVEKLIDLTPDEASQLTHRIVHQEL